VAFVFGIVGAFGGFVVVKKEGIVGVREDYVLAEERSL
jgi:hypothetical protein